MSEVDIADPTDAIILLAEWIEAGKYVYTPPFAAALARLNATCARNAPPETTDDDQKTATA